MTMTTQRGNTWSVTINNPTNEDDEAIALARQRGWMVDGQLEQGSSGTPHYQLIVKTPQVRFSAVKKLFPRAHIELAHNCHALEQYVKKVETRVAALPESSDQYPSLSKFWRLMYQWMIRHKSDGKPTFRFVYDEDGVSIKIDYPHYFRKMADRDARLDIFDVFVKDLIRNGYHVETMAVNPQIRSAWKWYWYALMQREFMTCMREENGSDVPVEINLPTIHNPDAPDEEENGSETESHPS